MSTVPDKEYASPPPPRGTVETKVEDNCHRKNAKFSLSGFCSMSISDGRWGEIKGDGYAIVTVHVRVLDPDPHGSALI